MTAETEVTMEENGVVRVGVEKTGVNERPLYVMFATEPVTAEGKLVPFEM